MGPALLLAGSLALASAYVLGYRAGRRDRGQPPGPARERVRPDELEHAWFSWDERVERVAKLHEMWSREERTRPRWPPAYAGRWPSLATDLDPP